MCGPYSDNADGERKGKKKGFNVSDAGQREIDRQPLVFSMPGRLLAVLCQHGVFTSVCVCVCMTQCRGVAAEVMLFGSMLSGQAS